MLLNTKPLFNKKQMTNNKYRNYARKLLITKYFDPFIQVCIGLNIFILMLKYVGMPEGLIQFITIMNYIFTIIFTFEAAVKIFAYGRLYFYDSWNKFDLFIVIIAWVGIGL